ncbi:4-amino-4-deoxy-L-arabinose transferase-like glycosyltransferase [Novosphingobium sp. SG720]|nr:glycosyltransferase family 39 protein [Novosphingobium sp. SG720]NKJ42714.1 4-amino-4-deoxy-L-arabinose transferase-like glycosyltransferase [Novosphingobium sp. SG720]
MGFHRAWAWLAEGRRTVIVLFAVALGLRALAILAAVEPSSDAAWYFSRAAMLADGRGYLGDHGAPTAYWPPGWPLALSLVFRLTGPSIWVVGLCNLALSALAGWLTLDLGRRLAGHEAAGRLALLLWAVYPNAVLYVPLALTEVFYTTLLLALCWIVVARQGWGWTVLAGLVLGLATLVKAQSLILAPLLLAIAWLRQPAPWPRLPGIVGQGLVMGAAALLVIAPWTLRNHRELGAWVLVSTNGGITLLTGNNDSARGGFTPDDPVVKALDARTDLNELAYDREAGRLGMDWIKAHPTAFLKLMPMKLARLWGPDGEGQWAYETGSWAYAAAPRAFLALRVANQAWYWALLALFVAAFPVMLRARRSAGLGLIDWWLLPYGIAAYPSVIAMVFSGQSRFHYPAMPFVCVAAAWLIVTMLRGRDSTAPMR